MTAPRVMVNCDCAGLGHVHGHVSRRSSFNRLGHFNPLSFRVICVHKIPQPFMRVCFGMAAPWQDYACKHPYPVWKDSLDPSPGTYM